jgi:hypothetical protein
MFVLVYVDDILITSPNSPAIHDLLAALHNEFAVKDLGKLHFFLGIEVVPSSDGYILSQQRYIVDLLKRTKMLEANQPRPPWPHPHIYRRMKVIFFLIQLYIAALLEHYNTSASLAQTSLIV